MKVWHLLSFVAARSSSHRDELLLGGVSSVRGGHNIEPPEVHVPPIWASGPKRAVILMDRFAEYHGMYLQHMALEVYGVAVVHVVSSYIRGYFLQELGERPPPPLPSTNDEIKDWIDAIGVDRLEALICESDAGLAEAELFAAKLKVAKHNGINEGRRNKYVMNEAIERAGLKVVKQRLCKTVQEAQDFAVTMNVSGKEASLDGAEESKEAERIVGLLGEGRNADHFENPLCIVKPMRGAASDSVFLCHTLNDVQQAFDDIYDSSVLGSMTDRHDAVLVQEFAIGTEYALDIISRNGEHKVAAVWRYDKRPANGRAFVYHATELVDTHTPDADAICEYAKEALDALDIKWGMTHTEIIMTRDGCRMVEVNCRQHNMNFAPITMACIGYNALDMLLAAYLGDGSCAPDKDGMCLEWSLLPEKPVLRAFGAMVHFVNHSRGTLIGVNEDALREIQAMASVWDLQVYNQFLELGREITPTLDIRSDAGWAQLINDDEEAFVRDYNRIVELMPTLFFVR
jgi:hypothetical protein